MNFYRQAQIARSLLQEFNPILFYKRQLKSGTPDPSGSENRAKSVFKLDFISEPEPDKLD